MSYHIGHYSFMNHFNKKFVVYVNENLQKCFLEVNVSEKGHFIVDREHYDSLESFVEKNKDLLHIRDDSLLELPEHITNAEYFHRSLTYEDTVTILRSSDIGTYLVRLSESDPSCIVLAFVNKYGVVLQIKVMVTSNGLKLDDLEFETVHTLVRNYNNVLKYEYRFRHIPEEMAMYFPVRA